MTSQSMRRRFLQISAVTGLCTAAYSYHRGLRYMPLLWEPTLTENQFAVNDARISMVDLIRTTTAVTNKTDLSLRAFAPEPSLQIVSQKKHSIRISINNISPKAVLQIEHGQVTQVSERIDGISRILEVTLSHSAPLGLSWKLPKLGDYSFSSIGDSGGDLELEWCIKRAHALGSEFLLHLGDFNYQEGDYQNAIKLFNKAPLPCYVSIGNHDFKSDWGQYPLFLQEIGPLNHKFAIGKTCFANLDSAAYTWPSNGGHRGELITNLIANREQYSSTVAFTHRPLFDPSQDREHHFGSDSERDWVVNSLLSANIKTLLSGHLHIQDQRDIHGINNIVVGQGLGHQDLITNSDYSKMAVGHVDHNGRVEFEFAPLSMPMNLHCHPRTNIVKRALAKGEHAQAIREIDLACAKS